MKVQITGEALFPCPWMVLALSKTLAKLEADNFVLRPLIQMMRHIARVDRMPYTNEKAAHIRARWIEGAALRQLRSGRLIARSRRSCPRFRPIFPRSHRYASS